ncbi:MAG: hypothetical protein J0L92_19135 [Deltaproteobacteria bacterium]|nr:hypothetical protein [Deltaproteobacteria bacterium]
MPGPFLIHHMVAPLWADIGGPLAPVSIRDQMLRAQSIVSEARHAGAIGAQRPFLVIGGGAAGAAAAREAALNGVPTLLIERNAHLFERQALCNTRWIDPAQYDWPHGWYDTGAYPVTSPAFPAAISVPIPWTAGFASNLAIQWRASVPVPGLSIACGWQLGARQPSLVGPASAPLLRVPLQSTTMKSASVTVGFVLACVGFGSESTSPPSGSTRGTAFWESDSLQTPTASRVLVAGAGDGALQDFLRAATRRKSALDIWQAGVGPLVSKEQLYLLTSAEELSARAYVWSDGRADKQIHADLHRVHQDVVDSIFAQAPPLSPLAPLLASGAEVQLVSREKHFPQCYALNRFLVLFLLKLDECLSRAEPTRRRRLGVHVASLDKIVEYGTTTSPPSAAIPPKLWDAVYSSAGGPQGPFDAIVVRYGITQPARPWWVPSAIARQALPYRPH